MQETGKNLHRGWDGSLFEVLRETSTAIFHCWHCGAISKSITNLEENADAKCGYIEHFTAYGQLFQSTSQEPFRLHDARIMG